MAGIRPYNAMEKLKRDYAKLEAKCNILEVKHDAALKELVRIYKELVRYERGKDAKENRRPNKR